MKVTKNSTQRSVKTKAPSDTTHTSITTEQGLSTGLGRLFTGLPTVTSVLVGFTALAYVIGWLHAKEYFDAFGAPWIVSEISTVGLLAFSWLPVAQLLFFAYLGITDLMESRTRYKTTYFVLRHGWWFVLVLFLLKLVSDLSGFNRVEEEIDAVLPMCFVLLAGASIEAILIRLQQKEFKLELRAIYLIFGVVLFGFYFLPTQMGKNDAKRDRDPIRSILPQVILVGDERQNLRLLASNEGRFYIAAIESEKVNPQILVVDQTRIQFIAKKKEERE